MGAVPGGPGGVSAVLPAECHECHPSVPGRWAALVGRMLRQHLTGHPGEAWESTWNDGAGAWGWARWGATGNIVAQPLPAGATDSHAAWRRAEQRVFSHKKIK